MDLFKQRKEDLLKKQSPLADRMRPRTLDDFVGQDHIVGPGRLLRRAIQIDQLSSLIFYGPPGTGKTTLARIIANTTRSRFICINAVLAGVADIRHAIDEATKTLELHGQRTILFVDEVHRFNKAQQDALLPHVENGLLILIGATTENPYFEVNKALVSRSRIFQLKSLDEAALREVARMAVADKERGYGNLDVTLDDDALDHLVHVAGGDARGVLNALELAVETTAPDAAGRIRIDRTIAEESIQQRAVLYDKDGDAHYDTISAFIKSVRGSDPDAALYWMAKMIYAGEDPRFILRRLAILACEDVGLADPHALAVVMSAQQAFDFIGMPEGRYHLAHACLYLATAPKSNSSMAFFDAISAVAQEKDDEVPNHLRDASRDADGFGHGAGYLYPHAYRDHWVAQQYLPDTLLGKVFFQPSDQGYERSIMDRVFRQREAQVAAMAETDERAPFAPAQAASKSQAGEWMRRTTGGAGASVARVRDRIFELAGVNDASVVLDCNAATGLLTFEAARIVTTGGVWAVAHDDKSYETCTGMLAGLPVLNRPTIVRAGMNECVRVIAESAGQEVRFTAIIGRNVLTGEPDRCALVRRLMPLLAPGGRMVFAETVVSEGQRISALCDLTRLNEVVRAQFVDTEKTLYSDPDNPRVNWSAKSLTQQLGGIAGLTAAVKTIEETGSRRIGPDDVEHWFRAARKNEPPSLGDSLRRRVGDEAASLVRDALHAQLDNATVPWKSVTAFFVLTIEKKSGGKKRVRTKAG